jgi:diguanylate cyclase (GGDEF)-like protein
LRPHHDELTQLPNRLLFEERFRKAIGTARTTGRGFALLCLDLDGFKLVNDMHGHGFGDDLLVMVSQRLRQSVRESDTVVRMGGDEFAIIQQIDDQPSEAASLAKELTETVTRPFELARRQALVGVSIGISLYSRHGESPDQLLRNADQALYRAKKSGRKTYCVFDPARRPTRRNPFWSNRISRTPSTHGTSRWPISQYAKPGPRISSGSRPCRGGVIHCLARSSPICLFRSRRGVGSSFRSAGGCWNRVRGRGEMGTSSDAFRESVPLQFRLPDLPDQVADILNQTGLLASRLKLEVTEGLLLDESDLVRQTMRRLQEQGIRIMLDDFGTAYANMNT